MKYLKGQQQGFHGALKNINANENKDDLLQYLMDEKIKNEKMLASPVGKSEIWQEYLKGFLSALMQIQELIE
jgi:hypothetical protein